MTQDLKARFPGSFRCYVWLGVAAFSLVHPAPAEAASILNQLTTNLQTETDKLLKLAGSPQISSNEVQQLKQFLNGGPVLWAREQPPKFPAGLVIANSDGTLKNTEIVQFLWWKRAQNPSLFDQRHPKIAPLFQQYSKVASASVGSSTQAAQMLATSVGTPDSAAFMVLDPASLPGAKIGGVAAVSTGVTPVAQTLAPDPAPVPEPASIASTLLLFIAAAVWRQRRARAVV